MKKIMVYVITAALASVACLVQCDQKQNISSWLKKNPTAQWLKKGPSAVKGSATDAWSKARQAGTRVKSGIASGARWTGEQAQSGLKTVRGQVGSGLQRAGGNISSWGRKISPVSPLAKEEISTDDL